MKTKRIINATFWTVLAVVLVVYVCIEWHRQGCGVSSLVLAAAVYMIGCGGFGFIADEHIRGN